MACAKCGKWPEPMEPMLNKHGLCSKCAQQEQAKSDKLSMQIQPIKILAIPVSIYAYVRYDGVELMSFGSTGLLRFLENLIGIVVNYVVVLIAMQLVYMISCMVYERVHTWTKRAKIIALSIIALAATLFVTL